MRLNKGFENFVLFWSAKKYVCARRGFRVRAPFLPIDMSKTFLGSFSCLLAGWISLLFFSIHFFSFSFCLRRISTTFSQYLIVFNHNFSHLLSLIPTTGSLQGHWTHFDTLLKMVSEVKSKGPLIFYVKRKLRPLNVL